MSSLGIKIGSEIFAAAATPDATAPFKVDAIKRQALLFWRPGQHPELRPVGAVASPTAEAEIAGFVDRVGDPVEVVASDGSAHRAEDLVAAGVAFLCRYMAGAFDKRPDISVSYPSHWDAPVLAAFERSLEGVGLSAIRRVPESRAILASARGMRGVPSTGILAVYDLGANGLSLTLANAETLGPVGTTLRNTDFGSAQADYSILRHVLNLSEDEAGELDYDDPAVVRELAFLRDKCRVAKETLSAETATIIDVELGRFRDGIRLVRSELEEMVREPIQRSADLIREVLQANNVGVRSLSAIVLAGGGASMPFVTEYLSSEFGVPVVRDQDTGLTSARGAAVAPDERPGASPPAIPPQRAAIPTPVESPTPARRDLPRERQPEPVSQSPSQPPSERGQASSREFPPPPPPPVSWSGPTHSASHQRKSGRRVPVAGIVMAVAGVLLLVVLGAMMFSSQPEPTSTENQISTTSRPLPTTVRLTTTTTAPATVQWTQTWTPTRTQQRTQCWDGSYQDPCPSQPPECWDGSRQDPCPSEPPECWDGSRQDPCPSEPPECWDGSRQDPCPPEPVCVTDPCPPDEPANWGRPPVSSTKSTSTPPAAFAPPTPTGGEVS